MILHGVDVSGYQPNWTPAAGDSFVFVKATEGRTYISKSAVNQLKAARDKGLQVGHYHFLWPDHGVEQAAWFVSNTDIRAGDLLVCDFENTKGGHPSAADAAAFIAEVKRRKPSNKVGLYCNKYDWTSTGVKAGDFLWIAQYGVTKPGILAEWQFWQYSDQPIDQNRASSQWSTLDELKAWANGGSTPPAYPTPKTNDVYLSKLHLGQQDSDSVWHLQAALNVLGAKLTQNGDLGKTTLEAWAREVFDEADYSVTIHNDL